MNGRIKYYNLPVTACSSGDALASGEGAVKYYDTWSSPHPCVTVDIPGVDVVFPIYIADDKKTLYYPVDTSYNKSIVFCKK